MSDLPLESPRPIKLWLQAQGAWVVNVHGGGYAVGMPDLIACYRGRFLAVEVKRKRAPSKRHAKLQSAIRDKITEAGGIALVVTSVNELRDALSEVLLV